VNGHLFCAEIRNCRSLLEETGWLGCWLHRSVLKNLLAGLENVVSMSREAPVGKLRGGRGVGKEEVGVAWRRQRRSVFGTVGPRPFSHSTSLRSEGYLRTLQSSVESGLMVYRDSACPILGVNDRITVVRIHQPSS
jgi:hypothetical protein